MDISRTQFLLSILSSFLSRRHPSPLRTRKYGMDEDVEVGYESSWAGIFSEARDAVTKGGGEFHST
ncbi:MAG: hypothetical protein M1508_12550 [Nitrospirae bacterium]|nr:hypothetical protein [Nitrospirota bacterium]MCL5421075.1 hypothetical protein [Nitrospirota bacterium]